MYNINLLEILPGQFDTRYRPTRDATFDRVRQKLHQSVPQCIWLYYPALPPQENIHIQSQFDTLADALHFLESSQEMLGCVCGDVFSCLSSAAAAAETLNADATPSLMVFFLHLGKNSGFCAFLFITCGGHRKNVFFLHLGKNSVFCVFLFITCGGHENFFFPTFR